MFIRRALATWIVCLYCDQPASNTDSHELNWRLPLPYKLQQQFACSADCSDTEVQCSYHDWSSSTRCELEKDGANDTAEFSCLFWLVKAKPVSVSLWFECGMCKWAWNLEVFGLTKSDIKLQRENLWPAEHFVAWSKALWTDQMDFYWSCQWTKCKYVLVSLVFFRAKRIKLLKLPEATLIFVPPKQIMNPTQKTNA